MFKQLADAAKQRLKFNFPYDTNVWIKDMNMMMENYHKHTTWSNLVQIDSATSIQEFINHSDRYGRRLYFSTEHGYPGEWLYCYDICKQTQDEKYRNKIGISNPVKFRYGAEVYWVKDRLAEHTEEFTDKHNEIHTRNVRDNTNCHMVIIARNYNAIRKCNYIISCAHDDGFYYKPRIDLNLLFTLNSDDVYITSACVAGWKYSDAEDIWLKIWEHFGDSFFLEYQTHNTEQQKKINSKIFELSQKYGIQTIIGLDTHYVNEEDSQKRDNLLKRKGLHYEDEDGWYMDDPDGNEVFRRMMEQGVIPEGEVLYAMMNTHVFMNGCEDIEYDTEFKIPILDKYKHLTYEQRCDELKKILQHEYSKEDDNHKSKEREDAVAYECGEYCDSGCADYPLDNYNLVSLAINKYGGQLTTTSRGSAASYYTNKLMHFTTMDRFEAEVPIFPERFITKDRILASHQMPDLDLNCSSQEPFVKAARELFGEHGCYPLLAVGKLGEKSGFKLYADIQGIEPSLANDITSEIDKYNEALKNVDDDEDRKNIHIEDYITDSDHLRIFYDSKPYQGIIEQAKVHACFVGGQIVLTSSGYKNIEDIVIGDKVLSHDNEYHEVINLKTIESDDIYTIKTTGDNLEVTGDHLIYVISNENANGTHRVFGKPHWKKVSELDNNDWIGSPINNMSIVPQYQNNNITYKSEMLDIKDPDFWWLVGRYIGDGWTEHPNRNGKLLNRIVICCNKNNNELLEISTRIPKYLHFHVDEYRTSYKFVTENKVLFDFLQQFGKYSYGKHLTDTIFNLPINLLKNFLEGYLDADGSLNVGDETAPELTFCTVSKDLAYGLQQCIHKVYKSPCTIKITKPGKDIIEGRIVNRRKKYRGRFLINPEKHKKTVNKYLYGMVWFKIRSISKQDYGETKVYDLTVKSAHSYTVNNLAVHNCGFCLFNGNVRQQDVVGYGDIRYEIGLIRCHSESTGKSTIVANVEGGLLDSYGYVKDDFLIVDVVGIIHKLYQSIGMNVPTVTELRKMVTNDQQTWNLYANGITCCLNQCEKVGTTKRAMQYKPKNIKELAAFIAAIRPGFKSHLNQFLARESYTSGETAIDDLLKDSFNFMLYQESVMLVYSYLGIPMKESYDTIKKISKKKLVGEALQHVEDNLRNHWLNNIGNLDNFEPVYKVIKDSQRYAFNSPHALAMANDSLYEAWMKGHHTSKFYEVTLNHYQDKNDKNKVAELEHEAMKFYGYQIGSYGYGQDNTRFTVDDNQKIIYPSLSSVKGIGEKAVSDIYEIYKKGYTNFVDIYLAIKGTKLNGTVFRNLIKIGYFHQFGSIKKLLQTVDVIDSWRTSSSLKKTISKSKISELGLDGIDLRKYATDVSEKTGKVSDKQYKIFDWNGFIKDVVSRIPDNEYRLHEIIQFQQDILGYIEFSDSSFDKRLAVVTKLNTNYSPKFEAFCLNNRQVSEFKIHKRKNPKDRRVKTTWAELPLKDGDIIYLKECKKEPKRRKNSDGEWEDIPGVFDWWLNDYSIVNI